MRFVSRIIQLLYLFSFLLYAALSTIASLASVTKRKPPTQMRQRCSRSVARMRARQDVGKATSRARATSFGLGKGRAKTAAAGLITILAGYHIIGHPGRDLALSTSDIPHQLNPYCVHPQPTPLAPHLLDPATKPISSTHYSTMRTSDPHTPQWGICFKTWMYTHSMRCSTHTHQMCASRNESSAMCKCVSHDSNHKRCVGHSYHSCEPYQSMLTNIVPITLCHSRVYGSTDLTGPRAARPGPQDVANILGGQGSYFCCAAHLCVPPWAYTGTGEHLPPHSVDKHKLPYHYKHDTPSVLASQGIHPHPGPPKPFGPSKTHHTLSAHNITCLNTHIEHLCEKEDIDVHLLSEISAPPKDHENLKWQAKLGKKHLQLGPLVPNKTFNLGGVGALSPKLNGAIRIKPKCEAFQQVVEAGRCDHFHIKVDKCFGYDAYITYLPTGASKNPKAKKQANTIIHAVQQQIKCHPTIPTCLVGDFNCDLRDLKALCQLLDDEGWKDLGEHANLWGRSKGEATCLGHNAKKMTRRDYILVNTTLFPHIDNFAVAWDDKIPSHAATLFQIKKGNDQRCYNSASKPQSLQDALWYQCCESHAKWHEKSHKEKQREWNACLETFQTCLDNKLRCQGELMKARLAVGDSERWWALFASAIEEAVGEHCRMDAE